MASVKKLHSLAPPFCIKKCSTCISPYYASNLYIVKGYFHYFLINGYVLCSVAIFVIFDLRPYNTID